MAFINPYTFIRFPAEVRREEPLGHAPTREQAKRRYTGTLTVRWEVQTPIAIPADGSWGMGPEAEPGTQVRGAIRIPGSSVKGAVRSLHEALFAGCARILDANFTPVYREAMTTELLSGWQLAIVMAPPAAHVAETDPPGLKVMLCEDVHWTRGGAIKAKAAPQLPRTGDFIRPADGFDEQYRENLYRSVDSFVAAERGTQWRHSFRRALAQQMSVILVTDTSARDPNQPYYWATAKPTGQSLIRVAPSALKRFRQKLRGADKIDDPQDTTPVFENVSWPPRDGTPVAQRRTVDGHLREGDVIWVRVSDNEVTDIKLSLGWRRPAGGKSPSLLQRVPKHVKPCRRLKDGLCLSCTVFGSIDAEAADKQVGAQDGYAGHVRFGDITGTCTAGRSTVRLAPLGEPHPGAGMFYLTPITRQQMANRTDRGDFPTQWDSSAGESNGTRRLRGRKFYWHSDPAEQKDRKNLRRERYLAQPEVHTNLNLLPQVHLINSGELTQTITFDGLDATALASLLATLNPAVILGGDGAYALHLGRGKPLGLGSVRASVSMRMTTTADRYTDGEPALLTEVPELDTVLAVGLPARCGDLTVLHKEARKVLDLNGLGGHAVDVSYPTTKDWHRFGCEDFHESYAYFEENSGQVRGPRNAPRRGPWAPLPDLLQEGE